MIWKEILFLFLFWLLLHGCCTLILEPKIKQFTTIKKVENVDLRDEDDTLSEIFYDDIEIDSGRVLFSRNCSACHSFDKDFLGPKLDKSISFKHMEESISDIGILMKEYEHTGNLVNKWNRKAAMMPKYVDVLKPQEITFIKKYIVYKIKNN